VLSAAHTAADIEQATEIFERTVLQLRDEAVVKLMPG
jgi:hypothetical protein